MLSRGDHGRPKFAACWPDPHRPVEGDAAHVVAGCRHRARVGAVDAVRLATFLMSREAQERLVAGNAWPAIRADAYGQAPAAQRETFEAVRRRSPTAGTAPRCRTGPT